MNITELDSYNLDDAVKFNQNLNPILWDHGEHLRPEVRTALLDIADDFKEFLGVPDLAVKDITISGSNAAYTYTPHSDIDLHLLVDIPELNDEVYRELFNAKKYQYNDEHDITIGGYDVELYVQDANQPVVSQGEYSVLNNKWIQVPRRAKANIDDVSTRSKYEDLVARIDQAIMSGEHDRMNKLLEKIRTMRKTGLAEHGEFGPENLAFKILRTQGYIKKLSDAVTAARDEELSLSEQTKIHKPVKYGFRSYTIEDVTSTPDGVSPSTRMFLSEEPKDLLEIIKEFVAFSQEYLELEKVPKIVIKKDPAWSERNKSFGCFDLETGILTISAANRHPMDILRTLAHELVHRKQAEKTDLAPEAGETGSPEENDANAKAGVLMREFAQLHPDYFEDDPITENASGYIPTKKQARDPRYSMALTVDIKPGEVGRQANKLGLKTNKQGIPQIANPNGLAEAVILEQAPLGLDGDLDEDKEKVISKMKSKKLVKETTLGGFPVKVLHIQNSGDQLDELSNEKLRQYKTAAAADAGASDLAGNTERANKRFSGIIKATKKQFANDVKKPGVAEEASPMIKPPANRFDTKQEAFAYAKKHGGKVFKSTYTDPNNGMKNTTFVVKLNEQKVTPVTPVVKIQNTKTQPKQTVHVPQEKKKTPAVVNHIKRDVK